MILNDMYIDIVYSGPQKDDIKIFTFTPQIKYQ
jgi:hypothetical protein